MNTLWKIGKIVVVGTAVGTVALVAIGTGIVKVTKALLNCDYEIKISKREEKEN